MRSLDDSRDWRGYIAGMNSDPLELKEARAEYDARWEAVEAVKAQEPAAMTEERARQIIQMLGAVEGWRTANLRIPSGFPVVTPPDLRQIVRAERAGKTRYVPSGSSSIVHQTVLRVVRAGYGLAG